jgi:hypothetical protein
MIDQLKHFKIIAFLILSNFCFSQTIINTENMMKDIDDSKLSYNLAFQGDFNFGNIDLIQFNTSHQFAKSVDRNLFRVLFNYEYIEEGDQKIAADYTGQLRYNYSINKNSLFAFAQAQNLKSLRMNHRYISGGGYRHNLFSKDNDYLDLSAGLFFEDELYDKDQAESTQVYNWRYSFSSFGKYTFSENFYANISIYYQINTSNTSDYRLFIQPRIYYSLPKFDIYLDYRYRHHSTPYVDIKKTDSSLEIGVEFSI